MEEILITDVISTLYLCLKRLRICKILLNCEQHEIITEIHKFQILEVEQYGKMPDQKELVYLNDLQTQHLIGLYRDLTGHIYFYKHLEQF